MTHYLSTLLKINLTKLSRTRDIKIHQIIRINNWNTKLNAYLGVGNEQTDQFVIFIIN